MKRFTVIHGCDEEDGEEYLQISVGNFGVRLYDLTEDEDEEESEEPRKQFGFVTFPDPPEEEGEEGDEEGEFDPEGADVRIEPVERGVTPATLRRIRPLPRTRRSK
jgi:hypothetical protein